MAFFKNSGQTPTQEKTVTSSRSTQTVTPDDGYALSKVTVNALVPSGTYKPTERKTNNDMGTTGNYRYVDTTSIPNSNSGTYTYASGSTGGTVDMGTTNTYRYVNATNVYAKGKTDGASEQSKILPAYLTSSTHFYMTVGSGAQAGTGGIFLDFSSINKVYVKAVYGDTASVSCSIGGALSTGCKYNSTWNVLYQNISNSSFTVIDCTSITGNKWLCFQRVYNDQSNYTVTLEVYFA